MLDARRRACLQAMGIELWSSNDRAVPVAARIPATPLPEAVPMPIDDVAPVIVEPSPPPEPAPTVGVAESAPAMARPVASDLLTSPDLDWDALRRTALSCSNCDLHQTRTQVVFGVGDPKARLMIIGEAPGVDEDRQGEPFVGRAGQLLTMMLAAIGFARDQVYIANIIKCRPPGNRDPHAEEAAACQAFLHRQIELIRPDLILSVGRVSAHHLLQTAESVGRLRGRIHRFDPGDIPLIVTYHPAYLLRRPDEKAKSWADLQAVHRLLNTPA